MTTTDAQFHRTPDGRILSRDGREYQLFDVHEVDDLRSCLRRCGELEAEVRRLRADVRSACRMFSKRTWTGSLNMPPEFHERRGRKMAGLKDEDTEETTS